MATTTYSIPTTLADLAKVSTKLATAEHKASKLRAVHELAAYVAWKSDMIGDLAASAKSADFAAALARSAGHVSKLTGIVNSDNALVDGVLSGLVGPSADPDVVLATVADLVGMIDDTARKDETSKYYGKGAATVDAIYGYLGIGKTGGDTTWQTVLARAVKMAKADEVGRQRFLLEVESLLG